MIIVLNADTLFVGILKISAFFPQNQSIVHEHKQYPVQYVTIHGNNR